MTTIDLRGVWSSAKATQEKRIEVNRPGYDASAAAAAMTATTMKLRTKTTTSK